MTRTLRSGTAATMVAIVLTAVLTACSSDETTSPGQAALLAAKTAACSTLDSIATELEGVAADGGTNLASKADALASNLTTAAGALEAVGEDSLAGNLTSLASDLEGIATSAPEEVQSAATDAQGKVTSASESLECSS